MYRLISCEVSRVCYSPSCPVCWPQPFTNPPVFAAVQVCAMSVLTMVAASGCKGCTALSVLCTPVCACQPAFMCSKQPIYCYHATGIPHRHATLSSRSSVQRQSIQLRQPQVPSAMFCAEQDNDMMIPIPGQASHITPQVLCAVKILSEKPLV